MKDYVHTAIKHDILLSESSFGAVLHANFHLIKLNTGLNQQFGLMKPADPLTQFIVWANNLLNGGVELTCPGVWGQTQACWPVPSFRSHFQPAMALLSASHISPLTSNYQAPTQPASPDSKPCPLDWMSSECLGSLSRHKCAEIS